MIDTNTAVEEMTGYPREQLLGRYLSFTNWLPRRDDGLPLPVEDRPAVGALTTG